MIAVAAEQRAARERVCEWRLQRRLQTRQRRACFGRGAANAFAKPTQELVAQQQFTDVDGGHGQEPRRALRRPVGHRAGRGHCLVHGRQP